MKLRKGIALGALCACLCGGFIVASTQVERVSAEILETDAGMFVCERGIEMEENAIMPQYVYDAYDNMITQYNRTGLKVTVKEQGASFRYNSIINLNDLSVSADIFQILVAPEVQDALEIDNIDFTLTDIYDESNFITIKASAFSGQAIKNLTEILVYDSQDNPFEVQSSETRAVSSWRGDVISLRDVARTQVINPFSFSIDPETLDFYIASTHAGADSILRTVKYKLGDEEKQGNRALAFTTNEVYLDVKINTLNAPDGSFYITKFLGKNLTGNVVGAQNVNFIVEDTADEEGVLPYAVVGMPYRLPKTQVYAYGFAPKDTEISVVDGNGRVYFPGGNSFVPHSEGECVIRYSAIVNGVAVEHTIPLSVKKQYKQELTYQIEDVTAVSGETFVVNTGAISGGNGSVNVEVKLFQGQTPLELKQSGAVTYFVPVSGTYTIKHYVSDYLQTKVYEQTITTIEKYIFEEVYVPECIMANRNYEIYAPFASAVKDGSLLSVKSEMYVNGVKSTQLKLGVNESATVTFRAVIEGITYESRGYEVVAKSDKESTYYLENFFSVTSGNIVIDSVLGLRAGVDGTAKADFLMPLSHRNAVVEITPKQFENGEIVIGFQDGAKANRNVEISIKKNNAIDGTEIFVNGKSVYVSTEKLVGTTFGVSIALDGTLYIGETKIATINEWFSGFAFDGFSEWVYVTLQIREATSEAFLLMNKMGNQTISNQKSDRIAPFLELQKEIPNNLYIKKNETHIFPMAYAYDVLQGNAYIYLWIRDSEGNILFDDIMTEDYMFVAQELGEYWIGYYAYDREGQKGNENFFQAYIQVTTDVMPTISFEGQLPTSVTINTEWELPTINVNSPLQTQYYVYLIAPDYTNHKVSGDTIAFTQEGTYIVRVIGLDAEGNMVVEDCVIEVTPGMIESGCKSSITVAVLPAILFIAATLALRRKKEMEK